MAELDSSDVAEFTSDQLPDDDLTQQFLDAALITARTYVGWAVSPVRTDTVTLDGPGSRMLLLPTRKLNELTSVTEDDVVLDLDMLRWSPGSTVGSLSRQAVVRKRSGGFWSCEYQSIVVEMSHGYTEVEAADWRQAILSLTYRTALAIASGGEPSTSLLTTKRVDDVSYTFANIMSVTNEEIYSYDSIFGRYKIPCVKFV